MFRHYLAIALRNLRRGPFTAAVNVLTLALGLVCFVGAYAIVSYFEQSDAHFANADRTYVITADLELADGNIATGTVPTTNDLYADYLKTDFPDLETVARSRFQIDVSAASGERSIRLNRLIADAEFLDIFDLPFTAGDSRNALRQPYSVVLTEETAANLFGDDDPLGKTIVLANVVDTTVTGVIGEIPRPSHLSDGAGLGVGVDIIASWDVWDRIADINNQFEMDTEMPENWFGGYCCTTFALLPEGGSLTEEAFLEGLAGFPLRRLPAETLENFRLEVGAVPLTSLTTAGLNSILGGANKVFSITGVLLVLGGLVLGVACINYTNLATARAMRRAREIGMRKVVGARKGQVLAQYLAEAALLTTLAVAVAVVGLGLIIPLLDAAAGFSVGPTVFGSGSFWGFLLLLIATVTLISGAYPAFILSRVRPVEALRLGRIRVGPRFTSRFLVAGQFIAASFLLVVVFVMYTQNSELRQTGLGSDSDLQLIIDMPPTGVEADTLRAELLRLPQVEAVADTGQPPWGLGVNLGMLMRSPEDTATRRAAFLNLVGENFFDVMDMTIIAGRELGGENADDEMPMFGQLDPQRAFNIMVDRALTEELGFESPQAAVGSDLYFPMEPPGSEEEVPQLVSIIGVVENRPLTFIGIGATSNFYVFRRDLGFQIARISRDDVSGALEAIDGVWRRLAPNVPIDRRFVNEVFDESYRMFNLVNRTFTGLALFALFISSVGLFGMAVQVANRRTHEIGVRKTVGATTRQVIVMLLCDFAKPVVIANLIAWLPAFVVVQVYLNLFIHRIDLTPMPFLMSMLLTLGIAWLAIGSQAYRAARVTPAEVLRYE